MRDWAHFKADATAYAVRDGKKRARSTGGNRGSSGAGGSGGGGVGGGGDGKSGKGRFSLFFVLFCF
jgi:hypothetical protein